MYAAFCVIDDQERFVRSHNSTPVADAEDTMEMGKRGMGSLRWTYRSEVNVLIDPSPEDRGSSTEEALMVKVKRKRLDTFFEFNQTFSSRRDSTITDEVPLSSSIHEADVDSFDKIRRWWMGRRNVRPLAGACSKRTRYIGTQITAASGQWAVLDQDILLKKTLHTEVRDADWPTAVQKDAEPFPHAVLEVRQEGACSVDLISILDASHLVCPMPYLMLRPY